MPCSYPSKHVKIENVMTCLIILGSNVNNCSLDGFVVYSLYWICANTLLEGNNILGCVENKYKSVIPQI